MHMASAEPGGIDHGHGRGSGDGYDQPDQCGKGESRERRQLQPEGMARTKMADHSESQQEHRSRNRGQGDQRKINGAVQALPRTAVFAGGEVLLVVCLLYTSPVDLAVTLASLLGINPPTSAIGRVLNEAVTPIQRAESSTEPPDMRSFPSRYPGEIRPAVLLGHEGPR